MCYFNKEVQTPNL